MSISEQDTATAPAEPTTAPAAASAAASARVPAASVRTAGQPGGNGPVPGADCHALAVRLLRADTQQSAAVRQLADRMAAHHSVAGWSEEVPCGSEEPAAQQRRSRELLRPVAAGQDACVRVVLLRYADGVADLVAVAHRRRFGVAALRACVIELLVGSDAAEPARTPRRWPPPTPTRPGSPPNWRSAPRPAAPTGGWATRSAPQRPAAANSRCPRRTPPPTRPAGPPHSAWCWRATTV
nr:hypothetical protein [Streptomyces tardus]